MAQSTLYLTTFVDGVSGTTTAYASERERLVAARLLVREHPGTALVCTNIMEDGKPYLWAYTTWDLAPSTHLKAVLAIYTPEHTYHPNCPGCSSSNILEYVAEWEATSVDDPDNVATLDEHQCKDCDFTFWA